MEKGRYIEAPRSLRHRVAQELGISKGLMSMAMSFDRSGEQSLKARAMLLESGEAVIMNYLPESETLHDVDGFLRQTFENDYLLVVEKSTGLYRVYKDNKEEAGDEMLSGKVSTLSELGEVQRIVRSISTR